MFDHNQPNFADRHIGPDADAVATMLKTIGVGSLDELADKALPAGILDALSDDGVAPGLDQLLPAASEHEALAELRAMADSNTVAVSMIGQGYFDTLTPPVLRRNILENPAWYTAYTPYQPEISQGRLEALLNFQTMVADLTGLEVANASMLDEGTAAAEAMTLMHRAVQRAVEPAGRRRRRVPPDRRDPGHPRRAAGHRDRHRRPSRRPARRRFLRGDHAAARRQRRGGRLDRVGGGRARARRAGRRRRRSARADADRPARRHRRRRRIRQHPTFRRANGIRRTARGLPRGARQACPPAARPAGRRIRRCGWVAGLQIGAADPRAAHPPRQGHQQYLHRAGAAGGDRRHVRQLSRRRWPGRDRAPGARARGDDRRRTGRRVGARDVLRHRAGQRAGSCRRRDRGGQGQGRQPVARRRRPRVGLVRRGHHRRARGDRDRGLRSRKAGDIGLGAGRPATSGLGGRQPNRCAPTSRPAPRSSSPIRRSRNIAPKPR